MSPIRTLIAESIDIPRAGMFSILTGHRSIEIVATAKDVPEALQVLASQKPDVTLLSSTLKGLRISEFMREVFERQEEAKVLLVSANIDVARLNHALRAGVFGYLSKNMGEKQLTEAVIKASEGEKVFSKPLSRLMTTRYAELMHEKPDLNSTGHITKREAEVLRLIVDGYTSQEIAQLLYISPRTVETHRSNLLQKLNLRNTAGLVRYALQQGHLSQSE